MALITTSLRQVCFAAFVFLTFLVVNHVIGAYMDINCPAVSKLQWHPFTVILICLSVSLYLSCLFFNFCAHAFSHLKFPRFLGAISAKSAQVLPGGWTEQVAKTCMKLRERVEGKGQMSMLNGELRFDLDSGRDHPNSSFKSHFG